MSLEAVCAPLRVCRARGPALRRARAGLQVAIEEDGEVVIAENKCSRILIVSSEGGSLRVLTSGKDQDYVVIELSQKVGTLVIPFREWCGWQGGLADECILPGKHCVFHLHHSNGLDGLDINGLEPTITRWITIRRSKESHLSGDRTERRGRE